MMMSEDQERYEFVENPPGSDEAVRLGCSCACIDNRHGRGAYDINGVPQYWISMDCPIHGVKLEAEHADSD